MKFESAEEAMCITEDAIAKGEDDPRWKELECGWKKTKKGGGYYRKQEGMTISVKQVKSGWWYVVNMYGGRLGDAGGASWFPTAEEAREAVNALLGGDYNWCWTSE